ncbi:SHOCT domain-containing protein [Arundinibacter roseus]|uniref:SHOCT domain-containing protein n=1 Tax=Arundinibacter roseus TaxID=2070510 RepID=A0A4R4KMM1_9BACT|nr:SHOCT domain-containing protein [Arundinibacter roseus]TDB67919.1 SHOCT domain-containing protein [Arundinibacter roseus]
MEQTKEEIIRTMAAKHGVSETTISTLLNGLQLSGGRQVQFSIPELGGMGQWQNGMVMIGDMFNSGLKNKVNALCTELAQLISSLPKEETERTHTTDKEGVAATFKGSQNDSRYSYYAAEKRLVIEHEGKRTIYDTTGYPLTGVQQSQSGIERRLSFTFPGGTVWLNDLKEIKS